MVERLFSYDEVESTNDIAKKMINILTNGDVVWTLKQKNGRGKGERTWYSPEGGLWFSIIFKPLSISQDPNIYTKVVSVATVKILKKIGIDKAGTKWPNDIYYEQKKLGGILTEILHHGNEKIVIVGVGLNVNNSLTEDLPDAISLKEIAGKNFDLSHLLQMIYSESMRLYNFVTQGHRNVITNLWRNSLIIKRGSKVKLVGSGGDQIVTIVRIFSDSIVVEHNGIKERVRPSEISIS